MNTNENVPDVDFDATAERIDNLTCNEMRNALYFLSGYDNDVLEVAITEMYSQRVTLAALRMRHRA